MPESVSVTTYDKQKLDEKFEDLRVELGYGESAAMFAVNTTSFVDVPGVVCTFTPKDKINWLDVGMYVQVTTPAGAQATLNLRVVDVETSNVVVAWNHIPPHATTVQASDIRYHNRRKRLGLLPAGIQRSYKLQAKMNTAGHSSILWAGAGNETYISVEER